MKNESTYAKKFATLFRKIKSATKTAEPAPQRDPIVQLVLGFLTWNTTRRQAEEAYDRIMPEMVDHNDLRVTHAHVIADLLGDGYEQAGERASRLRETLHEIYRREHAVSLDSLTAMTKKQARNYLDTLPGMTPYVAAQMLLTCFGGHAVPVDDRLADLLRDEDAVDPEATVEQIEAFLERQIKSGDGPAAHAHLQAWADSKRRRTGAAAAAEQAPAAKPTRKKQTTRTKKATTRKKPTTRKKATTRKKTTTRKKATTRRYK